MFQRTQIREGMVVRSSDGERLGKVFAVGDTRFQIEKGVFFPKEYLCDYSDIADIRGDEIILSRGRASLLDLDGSRTTATTASTAAADSSATRPGLTGAASRTDWVDERRGDAAARVELKQEELDVTKHERKAGEVRVRKDVVSEEKVVDVPVRRERVTVERHAVNPTTPAADANFREETVVVPVMAEEVDVQKRTVVAEEVVIRKDAYTSERRVADTVRREEVDIQTSGDIDESGTRGSPLLDEDARRVSSPTTEGKPALGVPFDDTKKRY
jgi:uncharacterized protein (TIGR02271 family)